MTGVNYIDPETGKMWVYPVITSPGREPEGNTSKKRRTCLASASASDDSSREAAGADAGADA
ncbi:unnamed protein product, partial [Ectocarpus sp. 8 AP-2014]